LFYTLCCCLLNLKLEKMLEIETTEMNGNGMITDNHLVKTVNGLIEAKKLKQGDKIYNIDGDIVEITKIEKCGKRPDAPIVGEI